MTEQEWLSSTNPEAMLRMLEGRSIHSGAVETFETSDRKLMLFAIGCCDISGCYLIRTAHAVEMSWRKEKPFTLSHSVECCQEDKRAETNQAKAALLRHVIGNPWKPWVVAQADKDRRALKDYQILNIDCLTPEVITLAEALYAGENVAFALHDTLLEKGSPELAEHFQEPYHPKGCWALDLLLGK